MSRDEKKSKQTIEAKASKKQSDYQSGKTAKTEIKEPAKGKKAKK